MAQFARNWHVAVDFVVVVVDAVLLFAESGASGYARILKAGGGRTSRAMARRARIALFRSDEPRRIVTPHGPNPQAVRRRCVAREDYLGASSRVLRHGTIPTIRPRMILELRKNTRARPLVRRAACFASYAWGGCFGSCAATPFILQETKRLAVKT